MARPQRKDMTPAPVPARSPETDGASGPWASTAGDRGYWPGGPVAQMQAELAQRLAQGLPVAPVSPEERVVRFLSVAGGFAALLAAYAGVVMLILR